MALKGYGPLGEGGEIAGYRITISKGAGSERKYVREGNGVKVSKIIHEPLRIDLVPIYPVLLPHRITTYIMVYLDQYIHVPSRGELEVYIKIPVDLAVYAFGRLHRFTIVDVLNINPIKYCLYGPPDRGVIARYARSRIFLRRPSIKPGEAVAKITIRNKHDTWVEIGRILLDAQILKLYYEPGTWNSYTQEITMITNSTSTASIYYGRRINPELKPVIDPPGLRPPRLLSKTEMLWGLM